MKKHRFTSRFKKDVRRANSQGKNLDDLTKVIDMLISEEPIGPKYANHPLKGKWEGRQELHIEPDWLLIYKIAGDILILERTGSHSELFG